MEHNRNYVDEKFHATSEPHRTPFRLAGHPSLLEMVTRK